MIDYLIVGAGLFGAVCARELTDAGKNVRIVEKRTHIGGNCYTETRDGQIINTYGGHIFHTNSRRIWDYIRRFGEFRQYSHHVKAKVGDTVYSFPPNRMTYQQLGTAEPCALRHMFFEGYTEKMWGRTIGEVPASVLARIPTRDTWSDEYFSDEFQGLPVQGYTPIIRKMLDGIDVRMGIDYLSNRYDLARQARDVIFTGQLDELFDNELGQLEWRGLAFDHWRHEGEWYQGVATMNHPDKSIPYLREEEWKVFYPPGEKLPYSWVSRTSPGGEPAYPVNDDRNNKLAREYQGWASATGLITGGRLADYRYYDMHQCIAAALALTGKLIHA